MRPASPRIIAVVEEAIAASLVPVTMEEIFGASKARKICLVRWAVWKKLREEKLSLPVIGRLFERDHTTVLSGLRSLERRPVPAAPPPFVLPKPTRRKKVVAPVPKPVLPPPAIMAEAGTPIFIVVPKGAPRSHYAFPRTAEGLHGA